MSSFWTSEAHKLNKFNLMRIIILELLKSELPECNQIINKVFKSHRNGIYWKIYRGRYKDQMLVKSSTKDDFHMILPRQIPHGTLSRRARDHFWMVSTKKCDQEILGTEMFKAVQCPEGEEKFYHLKIRYPEIC